jgi:hypothetical protein
MFPVSGSINFHISRAVLPVLAMCCCARPYSPPDALEALDRSRLHTFTRIIEQSMYQPIELWLL